ncbi:MAG: type VI secretion system contractile sheath large subunit [Bryobacteraceae bacterium]|jgi:type VI secretion system protein ImpC
MSERISKVSVGIEVGESTQPILSTPDADTPFRILILGDFSGRGFRGERAPIAGRRPIAVDSDNLDQVLASIAPSVQLSQGTLRFRALDDFHPDHIYLRTDAFRKLAELRNQPAPVPAGTRETVQPAAPLASGRSLLESIMEQADEEPASRVVEAPDALADFIKKAVEPHLADRRNPRQEEWTARVDAAAGTQMRAILHHPHFQSLEAAWRAVAMLVDRLQPDTDLKICVFDATLEELMSDAAAFERCLGGSTSAPWSLIVGNFVFSRAAGDAAKLRWLGCLAASLGAPFLGEAAPPSDAPCLEWQELVHSPEAHWIGLALPRYLLRLPYGKDTSPAEQLDFDEMPESVHADYLWGNPAFLCACVLGLAFRGDGWQMRPARHREIGGLPQHIYRADGESVAKPCAEVLLTDTAAEFILGNGFMPLASMKDQDSVLLVRLQSIADPPAPLSGRWASHS